MINLEQIKNDFLENECVLKKGLIRLEVIRQRKQDERFEVDWQFTLKNLTIEERIEEVLEKRGALRQSLLSQLDPYLVPMAKEYRNQIAAMDKQRILVERFHSLGRISDNGFATFNFEYSSLIEKGVTDPLLFQGQMLLASLDSSQPVAEPEEPDREVKPKDLPFPTAEELQKQIGLTKIETEIYGLIRYALSIGESINSELLANLIYAGRDDIKNPLHAINEARRGLEAKAASANIQVTHLSQNRKTPTSFGLAFINPPKSYISIDKFEPQSFHDSLEPTLQQPLIDYLKSQDFEQALNCAISYFNSPSEDYQDFRGRFFGNILESIARPITQFNMRERFGQEVIIIEPSKVFNLYRILHPEREVATWFGLNSALSGITVPDGIVMSQTQETNCAVIGLWECTAVDVAKSQKKINQMQVYQAKESRLNELIRIFNPDSLIYNKLAAAYFYFEYPNFPRRIKLPISNQLEVFFTILSDTPDLPGVNPENIFRTPFQRRSLWKALDIILLEIKRSCAAGIIPEPGKFLP